MVLQTDFFRNKFRRTNNLLRYFSIDKRKRLWEHKYYHCYRGEGGPAVPWLANTGEGWEGKMKLRFVKFLTSRENEIEKKEGGEEGEGALPSRAPLPPSQAAAPLHSPLLPSSLHSSSLHPAPPARIPPPQLVCRHVSGEQYSPAIPPPAVPLLPSFFIKLPKQQSVEGRTVAGAQLADPAVLPNDNTAGAQLATTLAPSSNRVLASHPGPKGAFSTASEAIGKQRSKMNYPVSSPSSLNK